MLLSWNLTHHTHTEFISDTDTHTPDLHDALQDITFHEEHDGPVNTLKAYHIEGGEVPYDFKQLSEQL